MNNPDQSVRVMLNGVPYRALFSTARDRFWLSEVRASIARGDILTDETGQQYYVTQAQQTVTGKAELWTTPKH